MKPAKTIIFPFVGDSLGGSHLSTLLLIQNLDPSEYHAKVVVHQQGILTKHLDQISVDWQELPVASLVGRGKNILTHIWDTYCSYRPLRDFLKQQGASCVHTNDMRMHLSWALPAKLAHITHIWHQRTILPQSGLVRLFLKLKPTLVAISQYVGHSLPPLSQSRVHVIDNAVVLDSPDSDKAQTHRNTLMERFGIDKAFVVGMFGNLRDVKQPLLALRSVIDAAKSIDGLPIVLAVFGEDRDNYIQQMDTLAHKNGFDGQLLFMGFQVPAEEWMAACDVVLAPSKADGFGRSIIEAMVANVPVIASNAGGHKEIIHDGQDGLLAQYDSKEAYTEAILRLYNEPQLRSTLCRSASELLDKRFGILRCVEQITALYDKMEGDPLADTHIVMVIADLGGGGAQKVFVDLVQRLSQSQQVTVITLSSKAHDVHHLPNTVRRIALDLEGENRSVLTKILSNAAAVWKLRHALKDAHASHCISFVAGTNVLAILATLGAGIHLTISERNDPARQHLGQPWQLLRQLLYRFADNVTANSQNAIKTLQKWVPKGKLHYVANPLAMPEEIAGQREQIIIAVGRLYPQKDYPTLLEAFAASKAPQMGWKLIVLGDGPLKEALKQQSQTLGIADNVIWQGFVSDTANFYQKARLFVMSSQFEGTPNALLEAASYGVACIISDQCQGGMEYLQDEESCLVFETGNSNALAMQINALIENSEYINMLGQNARSVIQESEENQDALQTWKVLLEVS